MDINEGTTTEDLWTPFKELVAVVEGYLAQEGGSAPYAVHTFESVLRRHKQTFLSLLKNPAKNPTNREEIKRGVSEGVNLPSVGRTLLSKELVDEAIIISDMYNVNEYLALELLHTAQRQSSRHPGLSRGLLAVLLYYDGRRALVHALRELAVAPQGPCWSVNAPDEIIKYVTRYIDQLISDGLLSNILDSLSKFTLTTELELLQNNRALPPRKHHTKLVATIENTRKLMAGVVFAVAAQRGLSRDIILRLVAEQSKSPSQGPTGALDEISISLQMALLYALDLSVLHRREDGEELAKKLPLIKDPELISVLLDELSPPANPDQTGQLAPDKTSTGVRALCQLALGLALSALKRAPQSLLRASGQQNRAELLDQDEALVDAAIDGKVFEYLDEAILSTDLIATQEFFQRRVHTLITDFIVLMHSKLMEMRVKADEAARSMQMYAMEGLAPPASPPRTHLEALLRCVDKLYAADPLDLRAEYWLACETQPKVHSYRSGGRAATLYKLVRLSGELVAPALLPAYLRALGSLAVPRHTWALLARRDAAMCAAPLSAHHLLTALQRYHSNLRSDPSPFMEHSHPSLGASAIVTPAARPARLLVRHEEVEAMMAALRLIRAVATVDSAACAAICDNLQWDAVNVMFGLICCHIPIQLKAELCLTLAALGGTAATAGRVWASLEANQLVVPSKDRRGLNAELQEVESRMEEYPLTVAFLTLLQSLCSAAPLPRALGAGTRPPGLDPYVEHVLHRVTIPAPHRVYCKPHEKWQILSLSFGLFSSWLEQYTPTASDFPRGKQASEASPPPGLRVALQLHSRSELLRLALTVLPEGEQALGSPPLPHKALVEQTLVNILLLLERALAMERSLVQAANEAGRSVLIEGLSKLIMAPDGPDNSSHLVAICRVVQHGASLPLAAATAVGVLCRVSQAAGASRLLLQALTRTHELAQEIRHGFVECLEAEEWMEGSLGGAVRQAKEGIVSLLQQVLPSAAPNLAHFLLGYQQTDDISRSALNEAGAAGYPRTCLHSILDILDKHISGQDNNDREANNLVEGCYRLLYWLCARPNTSGPLLRFLRSRDYFLIRHAKATVNLETASVATLSARSWVLRACACSAGAAGASRQHAPLQALLSAFTAQSHDTQEWEWCLLRRALSGLRVAVAEAPEPRWELFHAQQLRQAIACCDVPTGMGGKRISVSRVHALLSRELASLQATAPQRNMVAIEIQKVLDYVTEVNRQRNLAATLTHYYDSWRQLTEILFCVAPQDLLPLDARKNLLLNILQDLLNKIPPAEVLPQLGNLASGTILLLLVNLRHCYILQKRESNLKSSDFETTFFGPSNQIMQSKSLTLKFILNKILSWILVSGGCTQKMRVNLYGALLNYLNIVNLKTSPAETEEDVNGTYVSRLDSSKGMVNKEESALKSMVIDVINGFGENLCSIVCSDCIGGGHDVCRMVALSCLDTLIEINPQSEWMSTLTNQGYLRSLIDSLLQDDEGLRQALEPNPKSLRVLYVYESKMALLIKIASTRLGAETVLAQGALSCLANLRALDCHPDIHTGYGTAQDTEFVPSVASRWDLAKKLKFRQILVPSLALCDALLTTLGTQNHSCVIHVTHFLLSHLECIDMVLRAAHPSSPPGLLIELECVTSVIGRASNPEVFGAVQADTALQQAGASLQRVQGLMLALLPRFSSGPALREQGDALVCYKIMCNLLTYARNIISPSRPLALFPGAPAGGAGGTGGVGGVGGAAVRTLHTCVRHFAAHKHAAHVAQQQAQPSAQHSQQDLQKLLPPDCTETDPSAIRAAALRQVARTLSLRQKELSHCRLAVEAALYLVWAHAHLALRATLDFGDGLNKSLSVADATRGALGEAAAEFCKELTHLFNDRFAEELKDTATGQPAAQRGFLEVMLKDIKSMIQFSPLS